MLDQSRTSSHPFYGHHVDIGETTSKKELNEAGHQEGPLDRTMQIKEVMRVNSMQNLRLKMNPQSL